MYKKTSETFDPIKTGFFEGKFFCGDQFDSPFIFQEELI